MLTRALLLLTVMAAAIPARAMTQELSDVHQKALRQALSLRNPRLKKAEKLSQLQGLRLQLAKRREILVRALKDAPSLDTSNQPSFLLDPSRYQFLVSQGSDIRNLLERPVRELQGTMQVRIAEFPGHEKEHIEYSLVLKNGAQYQLREIGKGERIRSLATGSRIRVKKGFVLTDSGTPYLLFDGGPGGDLQIDFTPVRQAPPSINPLIILVKFSDSDFSVSPEKANAFLSSSPFSIQKFFQESSFGKTTVSGNVVGPFEIASASKGSCDFSTWAQQAQNAARSAGVNLSAYTQHVHVWSALTSCVWAGLAELNGKNAWINGPALASAANGIYNLTSEAAYAAVTSHELGHTLGLLHANRFACGERSIDWSGGCENIAYGDFTDDMGQSRFFNHYSVPHKIHLGWVTPEQVQEAGADSRHVIYSGSKKEGQLKAVTVKVPGQGKSYVVSYRSDVGTFDQKFDFDNGAMIHLASADHTETLLLSAHPGTRFVRLKDGESFVDEQYGIRVTQISHDTDSVTVDVVKDDSSCVRSAPLISWLPGGRPKVDVGVQSQVAFDLLVRNNDSPSCAPRHYAFLPNWLPMPGSIELRPGGEFRYSLVWDFHSWGEPGALDPSGVFAIQMRDLDDPSKPDLPLKLEYSYVDSSGCARHPAQVSVDPASQSSLPGGSRSFNIRVANQDSGDCSQRLLRLDVAEDALAGIAYAGLNVGQTVIMPFVARSSNRMGFGVLNYTFQVTDDWGSPVGQLQNLQGTLRILDGCWTVFPPSVALNPLQATIAPGGAVGVELTITNWDYAHCPATAYEVRNLTQKCCTLSGCAACLSGDPPAGLGLGAIAPPVFVPPGESRTVRAMVTADSAAIEGQRDLGALVTSPDRFAYKAGGLAELTVVRECRATPEFFMTPALATAVRGETVSFQYRLVNTDSAACPGSSFTLAAAPSTFTPSFSSGVIQLAPGAEGTGTIQFTAPAGASLGPQLLRSNARRDLPAFQKSPTASATLTVVDLLPDLEVTEFSAEAPAMGGAGSSSFTVSEGDAFLMTATIRNSGRLSAENLFLAFLVDDVIFDEVAIPSLAVGESKAVVSRIAYPAKLPGAHTISARARLASGSEASTSNNAVTKALMVVPDTLPPRVLILQKIGALPVTSSPFAIKGSASDKNGILSVKVNGQLATGTTTWSVAIPLKEGANTVEILATDNSAAANVTRHVLSIQYCPKSVCFAPLLEPAIPLEE